MPRYAIIESGKVINVTEGPSEQILSILPGAIEIPVEIPQVGIGWGWDGSDFSPPVLPKYVPKEVTMRQARLALHAAGLLSNVAVVIDALSEPTKTQANIEWEYSNTLIRSNSFVQTLGAALGLSSTQIDDLFIAASSIV